MELTKADLRTLRTIADAADDLSFKVRELVDPYHTQFDELSEAAQEGERGQELQALIASLEEVAECFDNASAAIGELEE